jgi:DNA-binding response OmpR family regulator
MTSAPTALLEMSNLPIARRILVVEDERSVQSSLRQLFEYEGYSVEIAACGRQCLERLHAAPPTAIILDAQLPDISGQEVFCQIQRLAPSTPIIVLSARSSVTEKVLFLDLGADDYVTKPFSQRELLARLRAAVRRAVIRPTDGRFSFDDVSVDFAKMELVRAGERVSLTALEFKVLKFMIQNPGRVISRSELLNEVWGYQNYPTTRTVDNHILRLRQKIEKDPANPVHFQTVHSVGYRFVLNRNEQWYGQPSLPPARKADRVPRDFPC